MQGLRLRRRRLSCSPPEDTETLKAVVFCGGERKTERQLNVGKVTAVGATALCHVAHPLHCATWHALSCFSRCEISRHLSQDVVTGRRPVPLAPRSPRPAPRLRLALRTRGLSRPPRSLYSLARRQGTHAWP